MSSAARVDIHFASNNAEDFEFSCKAIMHMVSWMNFWLSPQVRRGISCGFDEHVGHGLSIHCPQLSRCHLVPIHAGHVVRASVICTTASSSVKKNCSHLTC